jgi:hypothetical protein
MDCEEAFDRAMLARAQFVRSRRVHDLAQIQSSTELTKKLCQVTKQVRNMKPRIHRQSAMLLSLGP